MESRRTTRLKPDSEYRLSIM